MIIESVNRSANPAASPGIEDALGDLTRGHSKERLSRTSLKQWRLFHAVLDHDGFAEAAEKLHISQSSISHALAKLQDQLGVQLLVIKGRKAHITREGQFLLSRSRDLVRLALDLETLGENLRHGWEPAIRLAVEPNFPAKLLIEASRDSALVRGKIRLCVDEVKLAELKRSLYDDKVDLAISTEMVSGFPCDKLIDIEHLAIAHPDNPLFKMNRELTLDDLTTQFRIALSDSGEDAETPGRPHPWRRPAAWKMNSIDSIVEALCHGDGYAWLPRYRVQGWLDNGIVKSLPLKSGSTYMTEMFLLRGRSVLADSGARSFADALYSATRSLSAPIQTHTLLPECQAAADSHLSLQSWNPQGRC